VEQIITKSSNIGAAEIAITRLGAPELYRYGVNYGFGQLTVIPLPGESAGVFPDWHKWEKLSLAQFPMGQGISVTRLQIAMAMSAIANGGWLMQPMLISRLQEHHGGVVQRYAPQRIRQVISPEAYRDMLAALKTVPTKEGTCPEAALKNYVVAGKTGTAQVPGKGGYLKGEHVASFIGFFPADHPEVCISVVMDEPTKGYYGGRVCGPVFHDIAERVASYLHIPPDPALLTNLPPASLPAPAGGTGKVPGQALVAGGGGHKI